MLYLQRLDSVFSLSLQVAVPVHEYLLIERVAQAGRLQFLDPFGHPGSNHHAAGPAVWPAVALGQQFPIND